MLPVVREYTGTLCFPGTYCFFHKPHSESPARILYVFSDVFLLKELIAGRADGGEGAGGSPQQEDSSVHKKKEKKKKQASPAPESAVCIKPQTHLVH